MNKAKILTQISDWTLLSAYERIRLLPSILRALIELGRARWQFDGITPVKLNALNERAATVCAGQFVQHKAQTIARAAYLLPRIATRLPWRSDCLVQAMAAQNWLKNEGIASQIWVGVMRDADGRFLAHAWLRSEERIVTGGDVSEFSVLLGPGTRET